MKIDDRLKQEKRDQQQRAHVHGRVFPSFLDTYIIIIDLLDCLLSLPDNSRQTEKWLVDDVEGG